MNVKELMKRFLEEEGFKYEWNEEGGDFKFQGLKVVFSYLDENPTLLQLAVAYDAEDLPRYVSLDLCNELNQSSVLKHYLIDDDTLVVLYEEFMEEPEVTNEAVMEILEILIHGAYRLRDRMNELSTYLSQPDKTVN